MRTIETRRHTLRAKPGPHLSQAGVALARRVGQGLGPFDRVVTSSVSRAFETALAMGFALDEQAEMGSVMADSVGSQDAMPAMTVKEWAAAYRQNNEWEQAERIARLPLQTVGESVRAYFALCQMMMPFALRAGENARLSQARERDYEAVLERWSRLARVMSHAAES